MGCGPAGLLGASHLNTALLCELGERAYAHWWLCSAPDTAQYIRLWWPAERRPDAGTAKL